MKSVSIQSFVLHILSLLLLDLHFCICKATGSIVTDDYRRLSWGTIHRNNSISFATIQESTTISYFCARYNDIFSHGTIDTNSYIQKFKDTLDLGNCMH